MGNLLEELESLSPSQRAKSLVALRGRLPDAEQDEDELDDETRDQLVGEYTAALELDQLHTEIAALKELVQQARRVREHTGDSKLTNTAASWIKPTNSASAYYRGGFTNEFATTGSAYLYVPNNRVLAVTNGVMVFSGGNLAAPLTNGVLLTATNGFLNQGTNPMAVTVNVTNGYLSGWFKVPGVGRTNQFKGVLLQQQNRGDGYSLGTNQSGRVLLGPAP